MDMHFPSRSNPQDLQLVLPQLTRDQIQKLIVNTGIWESVYCWHDSIRQMVSMSP